MQNDGQPLSDCSSLKSILPKRGSAFYINEVIFGFSHGREPLQLLHFLRFTHGGTFNTEREWKYLLWRDSRRDFTRQDAMRF